MDNKQATKTDVPVPLTPSPVPVLPLKDAEHTNGEKSVNNDWVIALATVILLGFGFLGYRYMNLQKMMKANPASTATPTSAGNPTPYLTPRATPTPITIQTGVIDWLEVPQKVDSVGFFTLMDKYYPYTVDYCQSGTNCSTILHATDTYEPKATYYLVGTMKSQYRGSQVYLAIVKGLLTTHVFKGIGTEKDFAHDHITLALFIKTGNSFVMTSDYLNKMLLCRDNCTESPPITNSASGISFDKDLLLDPFGTKSEFDDVQSGIKMYINRTENLFNASGLILVKNYGNGYILYSNEDIRSNPIKLKTIINTTFVLRLPSGLAADVNANPYNDGFLYKKDPNPNFYFPYSEAAQLTWLAGDPPTELPAPISTPSGMMVGSKSISYTPDYDGCYGTMTLDGISSDSEYLDVKGSLTEIAKTDKGDILYDVNPKDFKIYQQFWFYKVTFSGTYNITYEDYLRLRPILIWKSPLGVYRMVFRSELVASKCWAEPLIYLYPTQPLNVKIQLDKAVTLTQSEPPYASGWDVLANPGGKIFSREKNRYYPYLYWEGSAPVEGNPAIQSVMTQEQIHPFVDSALTKLGLNVKERSDFEAYWEPKITGSPYYLISFYDATSLDVVAPLHVSPKPDTQIRVLMVYTKLVKPINVGSTNFSQYVTPLRTGFTLVEWGGVLHK